MYPEPYSLTKDVWNEAGQIPCLISCYFFSKMRRHIDFFMQSGYNRKEKCNKLQKSFVEDTDNGDSQRFLFE